MKTAILILGFLFGVLAIWALVETVSTHRKSARKPRPRAVPPAKPDPQASIATDPYGAGRLRRGERDTLPPGQRLG